MNRYIVSRVKKGAPKTVRLVLKESESSYLVTKHYGRGDFVELAVEVALHPNIPPEHTEEIPKEIVHRDFYFIED